MKKKLFFATVVAGGIGLSALVAWPIGIETKPIDLTGDVARGAYLARASGCIACHTDWPANGAPLAKGTALKTGFGAFYPPNLTTDATHGIGDWTVTQFARALRQGISPDGQPYYPAFPYPFYADFTDQDIADLWAAFQTVPAVQTPAPDHTVTFPFDQRWGLKLWRAAYMFDPPTEPVQGKSDDWNRGRKLVEGAAHCAACHTDRNIAGGRIVSRALQGSDDLPGGGKAPAITPAALRVSGWDVDTLGYGLKSGLMPDGDFFGASMGEVVRYGTAFLTDDDRKAMAVYLLDGE